MLSVSVISIDLGPILCISCRYYEGQLTGLMEGDVDQPKLNENQSAITEAAAKVSNPVFTS